MVDPVALGGDGRPGFNCPNCGARNRVFDFLDSQKAQGDNQFCHAAFAPMEDLEVMQGKGLHCNKTVVPGRLGSVQMGIPVNEMKGPELISFFLSMKNDGVLDKEILKSKPKPSCPAYQTGPDEGEALNVKQLSGIWIVSGAFGMIGVLVTLLQPKLEKRLKNRAYPVHYYDQMGNKTNILQRDDEWKNENTVEKDGKLVFVGEKKWDSVGGKLTPTLPKEAIRAIVRLQMPLKKKRSLNVDSTERSSDHAVQDCLLDDYRFESMPDVETETHPTQNVPADSAVHESVDTDLSRNVKLTMSSLDNREETLDET